MSDKKQTSSAQVPLVQRRKKSFQGHKYRRRSKPITEQYKADLGRVLGLTVRNNSAFDCNEATGNIAFPAGCVIVVCQVRKNKEFHICNAGHKNITCLRFSIDGQYIVTGESGHLPCIRVFSTTERCQLASFDAHKFGISCVAFSPNSQYVVSVGFQHDNVINVWNWRKNALAASNKVSVKVKAVAFSENSRTFVTVGNRHVKFWYIEESKVPDTETVPLKGRSGILGSIRQQLFCDVACGIGGDSASTYALSRSGMLCQFDDARNLINSVQLETNAAYCISVVNGHIVCGCGEGKILIYSPSDLCAVASFLSSDGESGLNDTIAISMDSNNMWIHCVHADHTLKVWDLIDYNCPELHSSHSYHSECVWDLKTQPVPDGKSELCFYSCSNDATVKLWNTQNDNCEMKQSFSVNTANQGSVHSNSKSGKLGIRSLCVSNDAELLAVGDRAGVIHIYKNDDNNTPTATLQVDIHGGDVLCVSFDPSSGMLASASRDRFIYVLDSNHAPTYTIHDHSAAVTAVQFAFLNNKLRLISCGVDKSLYFCTVEQNDGKVEIVRDRHIVEKHAMHDMAIISTSVLVACGGHLREYDIDSGKSVRYLRGSENSTTIIRVTTDLHQGLIAISCADKFVYLLNYASGECILELSGHSEVCTALAFLNSPTEQNLITASADSCIFVWKLHRCAKFDEVINYRLRLNAHPENHEESDPAQVSDLNRTDYFGGGDLDHSLSMMKTRDDDVCLSPDRGNDSTGNELSNTLASDEETSGTGADLLDMDMSLPTWLTGEKDKVIKKQVPGGKWANRFQNQYNFLDTPRTVTDWDDMADRDDNISRDSLSENSDSGEVCQNGTGTPGNETIADSTEDIVNNKDESSQAILGDESATKSPVASETSNVAQDSKVSPGCDSVSDMCKENDTHTTSTPSDGDNMVTNNESSDAANTKESSDATFDESLVFEEAVSNQPDSARTNGGATLSSNYESAVEGSDDGAISSPVHTTAIPEESGPEHNSVQPVNDAATNNGGSINKEESAAEGQVHKHEQNPVESGDPKIPPAFADFLKNLDRKRPRSTPKSLPVRRQYHFDQPQNGSDPRTSALPTYSLTSFEKNDASQSTKGDESTTSSGCQKVVENLVNAYEEAESMYQKVSKEDKSSRALLQSTFSSLAARIERLQLETAKRSNDPDLQVLLREYSDKLCAMVSEEFKKKSLIEE